MARRGKRERIATSIYRDASRIASTTSFGKCVSLFVLLSYALEEETA